MPRRSYVVASLLYFSGTCALIYQVAWLRELRLVFGASTPASAAVLAVFMAGLGYGSLVLSKRADRAPRPLLFYSHLEAGIAITAALTPLLLIAARAGYVALGGSTTLGTVPGTVVRLLLSAIVLLPPTFMMGGTLPAAARAAMPEGDTTRRSTALLYGTNTIGAVTGAAVSTFFLLEVFGTRFTLWLGCLVNGLVAVAARVVDRWLALQELTARAERAAALQAAGASRATGVALDREQGAVRDLGAEPAPAAQPAAALLVARRLPASPSFVLVAATAVGFVFMAMELVWYRMLSPLLGGSTYTFGLILAVALLGIGLGGWLYTRRAASTPVGLRGLAFTCLLEAMFLALPYALGDSVALFALLLRPLGAVGLGGYMLGWIAVSALVVLPASMVSGYQFPMLIALLGAGDRRVGRHVGLAYAFNTLGAIAGSLACGFVLVPSLTATGTWRYNVWLLVVLGLAALALHLRATPTLGARVRAALAPALVATLTAWMIIGPLGPTAVWRHSPIGAGRGDDLIGDSSPNGMRSALYERRRAVSWEADGRESSIALYTLNDTSFLVNGKSDGAAVLDGGTQVMGGLLGALVHGGKVREALVIGLGSGSTAGWLGQLPDIERVDVVELEPAMVNVARSCETVNASVLSNPKVHIIFGDAREVLLTTPRHYDLIFSEPSNPYRAGIASLFTREFYDAVRQRLRPDGVFVQWLQAYEVDNSTIRTVFATLAAVFPAVESWRTKDADLVLVGREKEQPLDIAQLRKRITEHPYREALMAVWRVHTVEGILAHYVARPSVSRVIAQVAGSYAINTDDRNLLEFSFPRALGQPDRFRVPALRTVAAKRKEQWPVMVGIGADGGAPIDWELVEDSIISSGMAEGEVPRPGDEFTLSESQNQRLRAQVAWRHDKSKRVISAWESQPREPRLAMELMVLADAYAVEARPEAEPLIARLAAWEPVEAAAIMARLRWAQSRLDECREAFTTAVVAYRTDPWATNELMARLLPISAALAKQNRALVPAMYELLTPRLNVDSLSYLTKSLRLDIGLLSPDPSLCVKAIADQGPWVPWYRGYLEQRMECYQRAKHPLASQAEQDMRDFLASEPIDFGADLPLGSLPSSTAPATPRPTLDLDEDAPPAPKSSGSAAASGSVLPEPSAAPSPSDATEN